MTMNYYEYADYYAKKRFENVNHSCDKYLEAFGRTPFYESQCADQAAWTAWQIFLNVIGVVILFSKSIQKLNNTDFKKKSV